jgi:hypothetical protein
VAHPSHVRYALVIALLAACAGSHHQADRLSTNRVTPVPIATAASLEGAVIFASNIVRPSWDHRVVIIEARIANVGKSAIRLGGWSVSATDTTGKHALHGIIMQPSGIKHVGRTSAGVSVSVAYDSRSYLPSQARAALFPDTAIEGALQVEFARQVDNRTITIRFHDVTGHSYAIGCVACQRVP